MKKYFLLAFLFLLPVTVSAEDDPVDSLCLEISRTSYDNCLYYHLTLFFVDGETGNADKISEMDARLMRYSSLAYGKKEFTIFAKASAIHVKVPETELPINIVADKDIRVRLF